VNVSCTSRAICRPQSDRKILVTTNTKSSFQNAILVREPYKDEVTVKHEIGIWLWAPLGARHQDEMVD
jgi:hypothetical protein